MIKIRSPRDETEHRLALAMLLDRPDFKPAEVEHHLDCLIRHSARVGFSLQECLVGEEDGEIIASCLCVDAPGRTGNVFIPSSVRLERAEEAMTDLLTAVAEHARRRGLTLLQAIIETTSEHEATIYSQAGYERLARLLYYERDLRAELPEITRPEDVSWVTYGDDRHELFAQVVAGTYEGSRDCARLNGLRDIDDILAGHRATGSFDPKHWLIMKVGDAAVGVILLADIPERSSWDLVYMGVLPAFRGAGWAQVLLRKAVLMGRQRATTAMTLTVDESNAPARRLYHQFGFSQSLARDAWFRLL